jgi:hypothetical protein
MLNTEFSLQILGRLGKGGFFPESTDAFIISSNTRTFYFPELENLNFWDLPANHDLFPFTSL